MIRKTLITFCLLCTFGLAWSQSTFPKEFEAAFGKLYVYHAGRITTIENLSRQTGLTPEVHFQNREAIPIFPYRTGETTVWLSANGNLPAEMSTDERVFVHKVLQYLHELLADNDTITAMEVLDILKAYQIRNAGANLPTSFSLRLEALYYSDAFAILYFLISILLIANVLCRKNILSGIGLLFITALLAIRWIVGVHVPMASGFEVMLFLSWCLLLLGFSFDKKLQYTSSLIAGLIMVAARICCDTDISALPTTLQSPLLGFHVGVTIFSYALFTLMAVNGKRILLMPGLITLGVGIILGSIWAKAAWGAYWSWDPKETWALITFGVYGIGLFSKRIAFLQSERGFHIFSIVAFAFVLFTYFGVNYFIGGRHGYV